MIQTEPKPFQQAHPAKEPPTALEACRQQPYTRWGKRFLYGYRKDTGTSDQNSYTDTATGFLLEI